MRNINLTMVFSAILLIGSTAAYHICQKSIPKSANPLLSIIVTFITALLVSMMISPFLISTTDFLLDIKRLNWTSLIAGMALVGIVMGHLLFYRSGWTFSTGTLFSYVMICLILIPAGLLFFYENISIINCIGIIVSITGLYLMLMK